MAQESIAKRVNTDFNESEVLREELIRGLTADKKSINPKFFYDEKGSKLFEEIMQLPEYYPTRTEISLLKKYKNELSDILGSDIVLIEPGAGNCEKVQHILPAIRPACYIPVDISADFLFDCARKLQSNHPQVDIHAIADDMKATLALPERYKHNRKIIFYPGSTIGNYHPDSALDFLEHVRDTVGPDGGLVIGVDLQKDKKLLDAAYNDEQGITAEFNINVINHVNALLDSNISTEKFKHIAFYNEAESRIEMHLESKSDHSYIINNNERLSFSESERIHTEYSYKYTIGSFAELAGKANLKLEKYWIDENELFSVQYYTVD